jgi:16S rRNA (adenine1518-N6/adenine1519-N6)-dimethyltransferase
MDIPFFSPKELGSFLAVRHIRLTKRYGQNFLIDRHKAESIVRAMKIDSNDNVLEIGPGIGTMTHLFMEKAATTTAVEIDKGLCGILQEALGQKVRVFHDDFLRFDMDRIAENNLKIYSSLPYNSASQIIIKLARYGKKIKSITVMLPEEIIRRLSAQVNSEHYGVFSIFIDSFFRVHNPGIKVERGLFFPVPQVDSRIVELVPDIKEQALDGQEKPFLGFLSSIFQNRRKYFRKALETALKRNLGAYPFGQWGLTGTERPENVPPETYRLIYIANLGQNRGQ